MSYSSIDKQLGAVDRKITKSNKIAAKGNALNYKDALKLGTKSNSIVSTINKGIKEYGVGLAIFAAWINLCLVRASG